ncbi:Gmad2 immunoglobulin-like domain-containing protein [Nocardioides sp.]|uniref:Gmad2 immunoglobulin-like domain-containing protein n=1 Tax=Nocardioides sp. TaxID=35761 RepID=UPI002869F485|nr:Gmad2 immunoglobulin-like domain-containing protein [Nocardioides sp.]
MNAFPTRTTTRSLSLAVAALVATATLAGCSTDTDPVADDPAPTGGTSAPPASSSPTPEPSESATTEPSAPAETVVAPVYFVGDTPMGPRLYREFRAVGADNPLAEAAALMAAGDALDPDYGTLFTGGFASVTYDEPGARFVVELADDSLTAAPSGLSKADARVAVQALVYTLQGVQQDRAPVVVTLDGSPTTLLGVDTSAGVKNAPQLDVLSLVNVTSPEEGATVSGSFTANGVASSFEATVPWEVRQGDTVVLEGFATAEGFMDQLYPWETVVDVSGLAPGDYTFVAMTDDPSGGEGPGPFVDTKTITVG